MNARTRLALVADDARMTVKPAADAAIDKIGSITHDAVLTVVSSVGPVLDDARDRLDDARERLAPVMDDARERLTPVMEDARDRVVPMMEDARDKIAPAAATAVAATKDRGQKAAVRLGLVDEPEPEPETHRVRNLLIVLGLSGIAAFVYTRLTGRDADPAWTASRDTAAASTSSYEAAASVDPTDVDDDAEVESTDALASGASTDQSDTAPTAPLASQESVESHQPTTPDEPLERREV